MTAEIELEARRYLRLFPAWMRADRGEEVVGIALDQLPAGTTRLPVQTRFELVRAGLHARRRGTPPLHVWNRIFWSQGWRGDAAVPVQWRAWLASVITTRWITVAYALSRSSFVLIYPLMAVLFPRDDDGFWLVFGPVMWVGASAGTWMLRRESWRARVLAENGFDQEGRPLPPHQVGYGWTRSSVPNTWVVPALVGFALVGGIYGPVAWFQSDRFDHPPLLGASLVAVALVAAVLLAGRRRLDRIAERPANMAMEVKDDRTRCGISAAAGGGVGLLWSWLIALAADLVGLHLVVSLTGPLAALVMVLLVRQTEQQLGRRVGEWDLHPTWGPQLVERPMAQLPSPPDGPSTPTLG